MGGMDITEILKPQGICCSPSGNYVWDIYLYVIFFFQLILFALLFSSTLRDTITVGITIMCAIADKTYLFGFIEVGDCVGPGCTAAAINYHTNHAFLTWVARVAMFAIPLIIVTQTKIGRAKPVAGITFVLSLVYTIGRWAFQQRVAGQHDLDAPTVFNGQTLVFSQASMVFIAIGYLALRRRTRQRF